MDSRGAFGDLLAAFNIDSEDKDIANVTSKYEAQDGTDKSQADDQGTEIKDDQEGTRESRQDTDEIKPLEQNHTTQVDNDNDSSRLAIDDSSKNDTSGTIVTGLIGIPVSEEKCVPLPNTVPQVAAVVPPAIEQISPAPATQLQAGAVLLPNLPQNTVLTSQPLVPQPQLQPIVQPIQESNLLGNQLPITGQSVGLAGTPEVAGLATLNGGAAPVLTQGMLQGLSQPSPNLQTPSILNFGAVQNGLIAVPMSLLPSVLNQNTVVTQNQSVAPASAPAPTVSISPRLPRVVSRRRLRGKGRPTGSTPTVQELLEERRKQTKASVPAPAREKEGKEKDFVTKSAVSLASSEMQTRSKTGRRKPTKRYVEFMRSKDESEEDHEEPQNVSVKAKEPVIDVNKPLTDQLISMSESTGIPSGIQITNVKSLVGDNAVSENSESTPVSALYPGCNEQNGIQHSNVATSNTLQTTVTASIVASSSGSSTSSFLPVHIKTEACSEDAVENSAVYIKQEPMDSDENSSNNIRESPDNVSGVDNSFVDSDSSYAPHSEEDDGSTNEKDDNMGIILPDGMRIKQEPKEYDKSSVESENDRAIHVKMELASKNCSEEDHQQQSGEDKEEPSAMAFAAVAVAIKAREINENKLKEQSKRTKRKPSTEEPSADLLSKRRKSTKASRALQPKPKSLQTPLNLVIKKEPEADITDKPSTESEVDLNIKKPIQTREDEERIASEAAARAASQALLRVAAKAAIEKEKQTAAQIVEEAVRKAKEEEQKKKERAAAIQIQEAAQRAASEAAARAASLAMARVVAGAMETGVLLEKKNKEASAEASKIASEAAARAAAAAAERASSIDETPEDLRVAEKIKKEMEEAKQVASQAAARAVAHAAARAATEESSVENLTAEERDELDQTQTGNAMQKIDQEAADNSQELAQIAEAAAARAVLAAQNRTKNFVPILPATHGSYTKPTHIKQILKTSDIPDFLLNQSVPISNVIMVDPRTVETREVHKVVTPSKQIITYPKNPSKSLRESLAWKSFQEGVKQGKYRIVQKADDCVNTEQNGRRRSMDYHSLNAINQDMRCPYCLIQMKVKSNLIRHITVCLINPQTHDEDFLDSHMTDDRNTKTSVLFCSHCSPSATSVKDTKKWSNVLCRLCVTKCADPKITAKTEEHYVITKSGYYVCKHCGIGLDCEADMNHHLSHSNDLHDKEKEVEDDPLDDEAAKKREKKTLTVSKILSKKEHDPSFQFRCGQCRLMFASVGLLLVHTSHCNLNQYIKVLERLSHFNCINCPAACKVVPDDGKPHQCRINQQTSFLKKTLQATRVISVSKESYVCLRCEEILPSNGHLILHTKQCNHAQYHLLMRYLDQPPFCNRCYMVFTGYKAYSQHSQRCWKNVRNDLQDDDFSSQALCPKCHKGVQREEVDQMSHNAVCIGLPCTQQRLLFPDGFNIKECCTIINSW